MNNTNHFRLASERLANEQLVSLAAASRELRRLNHRRVSSSALRRWIIEGKRGVRLDGILLNGRTWLTSIPAVFRFSAQLSEVEAGRLSLADLAGQSKTESARVAGSLERLESVLKLGPGKK